MNIFTPIEMLFNDIKEKILSIVGIFTCRKYKKALEAKDALIKSLELSKLSKDKELSGDDFLNVIPNDMVPSKTKKITAKDIAFGLPGTNRLFLADNFYYTINVDDVRRIIRSNPAIDAAKYVANDHDCDDFAAAMKGLFSQSKLSKFAFGMALSKTHAFNFFIDENLKIWIVEPQNSAIYSKEQAESLNDMYIINRYWV
jgi:hypothetical protein